MEKAYWNGNKKEILKGKKGRRLIDRLVRTTTKPSMEHSPSSRSVDIKFINKPLSNFDLLNFVKQLKIKYFKGVFSRDNLPNIIAKECGTINIDDQIGADTHRVTYRNI